MFQAQFIERERRIAAERTLKLRGSARVKIEVLCFPYDPNNSRDIDDKHAEKLTTLLKAGNEQDISNFRSRVPAVIDQHHLEDAIAASGISAERLLDVHECPELNFPAGFQLRCLHGQHRIKAASNIHPGSRWVVDLYLADLNEDLKTALIEEYSFEKQPHDGEIYCKIREYQISRNLYFENRWWARLYAISEHKARNLKQILRYGEYMHAFDLQLDIPALKWGMRLSTSHKIFATKCYEQNLCYLRYIGIWNEILPNAQARQKLSRADVEAFELTAPGACRADWEHLHGQLRSGKILGAFNEQDRDDIWTRVVSASVDRLIPSFYSYFEDVNYFQGPVKCVKSLIELSPRDSVSSALLRAFREGDQRADRYVVQESNSRFVLRPGRSSEREDFALRQIWIIAMRYSEAKLDWKPSKATLCEIAALAYRLGFKSTPILNLIQGSADRQIALKALSEARRPDRFKYDAAAIDGYIDQIVRIFTTAEELTEEEARSIYEVDNDERPPKRCGIPKPKDHKQDKLSLFLNTLHNTDQRQYPEITPFFVRRSVYFAFWDKPTHILDDDATHTQLPEQEMRDLGEQQQLPQPEHERRRQLQAEQERERQIQAEQEQDRQRQAEERLAQLSEQRKAEEERLARLSEQREAEEERLARLSEQREAEEERLARLSEQKKGEEERLARLSEQRKTKEERLARLSEQRWAGEKESSQLAEQREAERKRLAHLIEQRQAEEGKLPQLIEQRKAEERKLSELIEQKQMEEGRLAQLIERQDGQEVLIKFEMLMDGAWKVDHSVTINRSDPSSVNEVERLAIKYIRKGDNMWIYDKGFRKLFPRTCFQDVTADGTNTIRLIPESRREVIDLIATLRARRNPKESIPDSEVDLTLQPQVKEVSVPLKRRAA